MIGGSEVRVGPGRPGEVVHSTHLWEELQLTDSTDTEFTKL